MLRHYLGLALVAGALLAGCGHAGDAGEEETAAAPQIDACTLFTPKDAEAAAGTPLSGYLSSTLEDTSGGRDPLHCTYSAGPSYAPQIISLQVRPAKSEKRARRQLEANKDSLSTLARGQIQDIQGVGDAAFWAGGSIKQLHVQKGPNVLIVTLQAGSNPLEASKRVATQALARM
jgi:hypothetical protein